MTNQVMNFDRKKRNQLLSAIEIAIESFSDGVDQKTIEEISDFAVARLSNPVDFANPYRKASYNLTNILKLEAENPELAEALKLQAITNGEYSE